MRSCPRYHELLREATEAAEYQTALEGWTVSGGGAALEGPGVGAAWQGLSGRGEEARQTHPAPVHPGLPDSPGELHRAVIGRRAAPPGMESSRHTDVPGEPPPHPSSRVVKDTWIQIPALLLSTCVPSGKSLNPWCLGLPTCPVGMATPIPTPLGVSVKIKTD